MCTALQAVMSLGVLVFYQYTPGQYTMYWYIRSASFLYTSHLIYRYTKYYPNFGTRIIHTILVIRLGCHVLSPNMY